MMKKGMKREKILWSIVLLATVMTSGAICWNQGGWHFLHAPGKIVPAAVVLPRDGRDRERLRDALKLLQGRMDSLAADSAGKRIYDSLVRVRPGLWDSVRMVERLLSERGFLGF